MASPFSFSFLAVLAVSAGLSFSQAQAQHVEVRPEQEPAVQAVSKVLPAVVNINTERTVRRLYRDPYDDLFNDFFGTQRRPRELRHTVQSLGSGFIIDPSGYIVTNEHVVERAEDLKISVTLSNGKSYEARYITGDPAEDLALLKIESDEPLPYIALDDASPNLLGQSVLVVGNPLGYGHSVARGILSANDRSFSVQQIEFTGLVQTDAAINPGNSGGPLIDLQGKLVGVASAKLAYTPQGVPTQGIGFAIPAGKVAEKVALFRRDAERVARGESREGSSRAYDRLGLTLQELTPELSEALGFGGGGGVLISDVQPRSPAHQRGLRRGMALYRIGRYEIASITEAEEALSRAGSGSQVDLLVGMLRPVGRRVVEQVRTVTVTAR